jgi:mRNA interferase MazF
MSTVVAIVITSNTRLAEAPGNVLLPKKLSKLPKDSVVNVSQVVTIDRQFLKRRVSKLGKHELTAVEAGLRLVLALE